MLNASIVVVVVIASLMPSARAQQSGSPAAVESVERVRQRVAQDFSPALELALLGSQPQPGLASPTLAPWTAPDARRLGILTFVPPHTNGEFVSVVVPVGELATRAGHALAAARHRHAERRAHEEVLHALKDLHPDRDRW